MKDLTISIVAYHNYDDIMEAVRSIERFTDSSIDKYIYIIDNSSLEKNDEKRVRFEQFLKEWNDIEYLDAGANLGFGKGHNYIIDKIDSKYHAIVNPDILLVEDSFTKILDYQRKEKIGVIIPKLISENGDMLKVYRREVTVWDMFIRFCCPGMFQKRKDFHTMDDQDYTKTFDVPFAQGSFLVVETSLLKELQGFDDRYFMYMEDADLCKRINAVSQVKYYPGTTVIHKWEKGSHKNFKLLKYHVQSMFRYFKKWGFKLS